MKSILKGGRRQCSILSIFSSQFCRSFSRRRVGAVLIALTCGAAVGSATVASASPLPSADMPIRLSAYDSALGGINCDHDCTWKADGTRVEVADYGNTAACIAEWFTTDNNSQLSVVILIDGEAYKLRCDDRGGAINVVYVRNEWAILVDEFSPIATHGWQPRHIEPMGIRHHDTWWLECADGRRISDVAQPFLECALPRTFDAVAPIGDWT